MPKNKCILFYSKKCEFCQKLLQLGEKKNRLDSYVLINVDNKGQYEYPIPKFVTMVPTILTLDKRVLTGQTAMLYMDTINPKPQQQPNQQQSNQQQPNQQQPQEGNIGGFSQTEMPGFSDGFSFLSSDEPISHSFHFLNRHGNPTPENKMRPQNTSDQNTQNRPSLEDLMKARNQDPHIAQPISRS